MATTISITVSEIPNQSKRAALEGSLYLISDQAMRPPTHGKPVNPSSNGSSHHAHEVRSSDIASLCSLDMGAPHSGQNRALVEILAPQVLQECKDLPQYWQKVASGVGLPHLGQVTFLAISINKIQSVRVYVNGQIVSHPYPYLVAEMS